MDKDKDKYKTIKCQLLNILNKTKTNTYNDADILKTINNAVILTFNLQAPGKYSSFMPITVLNCP